MKGLIHVGWKQLIPLRSCKDSSVSKKVVDKFYDSSSRPRTFGIVVSLRLIRVSCTCVSLTSQ